MTFRDDSDALLARVEALERERVRLEEELAHERARGGGLEKQLARERSHNSELATSREEAVRENRQLEGELRRSRGPGRWRRLVARVGAWKSAGTTPADCATWAATYAAAVRAVWPLHACVHPLFIVPALVMGGWHVWCAVAFTVGAPVLALVTTRMVWLAGRRRLATAAGAVGLAIGLSGVGLLLGSLILIWTGPGFVHAWLFVPLIYAVIALVHFTRAVRLGDVSGFVLPWIIFVILPGPHYLFVLVFGPLWCWEVGARFVDRSYGVARS